MKPDLAPYLAAGSQILGPIGLATGEIPLPLGVPWWAALLATVIGPACTSLLWFLGKASGLALAGWLDGRAKAQRTLAKGLRGDSDPTNDDDAAALEIRASADAAAAAALRAAASSGKGRE
jgi:hypothetical protein